MSLDFAATYGEPTAWRCPDCGVRFTIYPALPFDHTCAPAGDRPAPRTAFYYYRLKEDDFVSEFCVANAGDPHQSVETLAPDGTPQRWAKREEGDLLVFRPPDGYAGSQGLLWRYDQRLQKHEAAPRHVMEREALRGRKSILTPPAAGRPASLQLPPPSSIAG